jgi:hypothetical protein
VSRIVISDRDDDRILDQLRLRIFASGGTNESHDSYKLFRLTPQHKQEIKLIRPPQ